MQFFYLLCSQFRQKASSWINKTLLLIKQQKWLSEFCVKIHRVASKNKGRSGDHKHILFFWPNFTRSSFSVCAVSCGSSTIKYRLVSLANNFIVELISVSMSFMKIMNKRGPKIDPFIHLISLVCKILLMWHVFILLGFPTKIYKKCNRILKWKKVKQYKLSQQHETTLWQTVFISNKQVLQACKS
jgi:hypothetical protein